MAPKDCVALELKSWTRGWTMIACGKRRRPLCTRGSGTKIIRWKSNGGKMWTGLTSCGARVGREYMASLWGNYKSIRENGLELF